MRASLPPKNKAVLVPNKSAQIPPRWFTRAKISNCWRGFCPQEVRTRIAIGTEVVWEQTGKFDGLFATIPLMTRLYRAIWPATRTIKKIVLGRGPRLQRFFRLARLEGFGFVLRPRPAAAAEGWTAKVHSVPGPSTTAPIFRVRGRVYGLGKSDDCLPWGMEAGGPGGGSRDPSKTGPWKAFGFVREIARELFINANL